LRAEDRSAGESTLSRNTRWDMIKTLYFRCRPCCGGIKMF